MSRFQLVIDPRDSTLEDRLIAFAAENVGAEETIEVELVYAGYEQAPDILRLDRAGQIIAALSVTDDA